ncbi:MAG: hypothetical protein DWQ31_15655 [Planctomycetota bacterium]|nr:MAG: hypothetical protein DWQ31_15655 [Planctomycetota bacterium]REJ89966.1 MAG: hypothetical protein DWQ35_17260 [Planctomycetota bacterium]REK28198.1 MAG: hypothetical protein DWQ42_05640 [Planctomycetota bacterium]REK42456.1 MAG: hypothetical protein DWQ46_13280 [Planctomycetota bacterium]
MIAVPFANAKHHIADGDLLLWRRRSLISIAGRGRHSHAAKAAWWGDDLFCLEIREFHGGRAVTLASQVERHPGRIDVFEVNPDRRWPAYDRQGATRAMRRKAGKQYGYRGVAAAALLHLPFVRCFVKPSLSDVEDNSLPEFCSQACASADRRGGGVDPVPNLNDRLTEPADLARSPFYRYRFTLFPS